MTWASNGLNLFRINFENKIIGDVCVCTCDWREITKKIKLFEMYKIGYHAFASIAIAILAHTLTHSITRPCS